MTGSLALELAEIPTLPGAACVGREKLFDGTVGNAARNPPHVVLRARAEARQVCAGCPVLDPCRSWVEALPKSHRPRGLVGGRLVDSSGRFADEARKRRLAATRGSTVVAKCR